MGHHLTPKGAFKSDKYKWCLKGFFALKFTDPLARRAIMEYARLVQDTDPELAGDLRVACAVIPKANTVFDRMGRALEKATHELNAIRARDGAPVSIHWMPGGAMEVKTVSEEYFSALVDECHAALKEAGLKS